MMAITPPQVRDKSFDVRFLSRNYETGRMDGFRRTNYKYPTIYNQVRVRTKDASKTGSGKPHKSLIRFYGPPDEKTPVWVWCDCAYFTFTLETALANKGTSSIKNSNGEPPTVKNKPQDAFLCKHLYRAADWALSQTQDKASEAMEKLMEKRQTGASAREGFTRTRSGSFPGRRFGR
jgi:hypothetical protein